MERQTRESADIPKWSALLVEAVNKPGLIMKAWGEDDRRRFQLRGSLWWSPRHSPTSPRSCLSFLLYAIQAASFVANSTKLLHLNCLGDAIAH